MQARPKRGAAQRANYVINYITLNFKEEQDLRKAIQASLTDARTTRRSTNVSNNSSFSEEGEKDDSKATNVSGKCHSQSSSSSLPIVAPVLASVVKKHGKRSASPASSKDTGDNSTSIASLSLPEKKKPKIPSQRKFAQNSTSLGSSTNTTPVKFGPFTPLMPTNEIFPAIKPATEDFLTFLCLRKTSLLPRNLNMFALNEEAMKNKKVEKPTPTKSSQTPIKQEPTSGNSCSSGPEKTKNKSLECNSSSGAPIAGRSISRGCSEKSVKNSTVPPKETNKTTSKPSVKSERKKSSPAQGKANKSLTSQSQSNHNSNDHKNSTNNNHICKDNDDDDERDDDQDNQSDTESGDNSWDDESVRTRKPAARTSKKSKKTCELSKRVTRSTSNVNDETVQKQLMRRKKPSNVAAKKLLQNSLKCKKKPPPPSDSSTSRGFVMDRVTRSIKHLRSMEESLKGKSSHKH